MIGADPEPWTPLVTGHNNPLSSHIVQGEHQTMSFAGLPFTENSFSRFVPPGEKRSVQNGVVVNGTISQTDIQNGDPTCRTGADGRNSRSRPPSGHRRGTSVGEVGVSSNSFVPISSASSNIASVPSRLSNHQLDPSRIGPIPSAAVESCTKPREKALKMKKLEVCQFLFTFRISSNS